VSVGVRDFGRSARPQLQGGNAESGIDRLFSLRSPNLCRRELRACQAGCKQAENGNNSIFLHL
jgi:hypothetical protein